MLVSDQHDSVAVPGFVFLIWHNLCSVDVNERLYKTGSQKFNNNILCRSTHLDSIQEFWHLKKKKKNSKSYGNLFTRGTLSLHSMRLGNNRGERVSRKSRFKCQFDYRFQLLNPFTVSALKAFQLVQPLLPGRFSLAAQIPQMLCLELIISIST